MRPKGIAVLALLAAALSVAAALEESIVLMPGSGASRGVPPGSGAPGALAISPRGPAAVGDPILGGWQAENAVALPGFRGGTDFVLATAEYRRDDSTDLLLHFEAPAGGAAAGGARAAGISGAVADEGGRWSVSAGPHFALDQSRAAQGSASASFNGPTSALSLAPGRSALLAAGSAFRDFSIEFWLYPANAENGEVILSWKTLRLTSSGNLPQSLACTVAGGRLSWSFQGFFERPAMRGTAGRKAPGGAGAGAATAGAVAAEATSISLRAVHPLVPRAWSHHLLRFDGDTGLLEYLVDGKTEATAYATSSGREGGEVWAPAVGAASPLVLAEDYAGLVDEFRITRSFVERPAVAAYGRDGGLVLSPIADLGTGNSRLLSIEVEARTPGATGVELSYRASDEWIGWRYDSPAWVPFRSGDRLPDSARGRYVQVRVELYPDGTGRLTPALSQIRIRFEPDPLPPPPARVQAVAKDGAIELRWSRVPEADVAGYLVYYGDAPGDYFGTGAAEGPSPVDAGASATFTLTGLPNGALVYLAVATYDSAGKAAAAATLAAAPRSASRAGEFSAEVSARPSRTAR